MLNSVKSDDMQKIVEAQVQKATSGDTKAASFVRDLLLKAAPPPEKPAETPAIGVEVRDRIDDWKAELRQGIGFFLSFAGPQAISDIAKRFNLDIDATEVLLNCDMFYLERQRWHMNNDARTRLLDGRTKMAAIDNEPTQNNRDVTYNKDDEE